MARRKHVNYCLSPRVIRNPRYRYLSPQDVSDFTESLAGDKYFNDKLGLNVPPDSVLFVPCGTCEYCQSRRRNEWRTRLLLEYDAMSDKRNYFVTLTFNQRNYDRFVVNKENNDVAKSLSLFYDRFRKAIGPCRYFFISELGSCSDRLHFHGILFNVPKNVTKKSLERLWKYGFVDISRLVDDRAVKYCIKYVAKMTTHRTFIRCSQGLGLGNFDKDELKENVEKSSRSGLFYKFYRKGSAKAMPCPRYYIKKFVPPDVLLSLFWNNLDSGFVRYANGHLHTHYSDDYFNDVASELSISLSNHESYVRPRIYPALEKSTLDLILPMFNSSIF